MKPGHLTVKLPPQTAASLMPILMPLVIIAIFVA